METLALPLKEESPHPSCEVHRFSRDGVVVVRDHRSSVFMGGFLLGEFGDPDKDRGPRNVLVVTLAKSEMLHLGRLAVAFGMTEEYLRQLRRKEEAGGLGALLLSKQGKDSTVPPELREAWCAMFAAGHMPTATCREQRGPKKTHFSYTTVRREYLTWKQARDAQPPTAPTTDIPSPPSEGQQLLVFAAPEPVEVVEVATLEADPNDADATPVEGGAEIVPMTAAPVRGGSMVQHVGCWVLLALAYEFGLHEDAAHAFKQQNEDGLRIALDAVICSLAIYQRCIEGVRRLATPTGPTLLRADRVPTASGVRKLFGRMLGETEIGGAILEARITTRLITAAHVDDGPAIFYVDGQYPVRMFMWRVRVTASE